MAPETVKICPVYKKEIFYNTELLCEGANVICRVRINKSNWKLKQYGIFV
jgi:hypothetical protein